MSTGGFEIEVGKEYRIEELASFVPFEFLLVYNDEVIACPCDVDDYGLKGKVVRVEKIEEVEFENGEVVNVVFVKEVV